MWANYVTEQKAVDGPYEVRVAQPSSNGPMDFIASYPCKRESCNTSAGWHVRELLAYDFRNQPRLPAARGSLNDADPGRVLNDRSLFWSRLSQSASSLYSGATALETYSIAFFR